MKYFTVKVSSFDKNYHAHYLVEADNLLTPEEIHGLFNPTVIHQVSIDGELENIATPIDDDGDKFAVPVEAHWEEMTPEDYLASLTEGDNIKEVFSLSSLGHVADSTISINRKFSHNIKGVPQYLSFTGLSSSGEVFEDCQKITIESSREKVIDKTYQDIVTNMRKYKRLPGIDIKRGLFIVTDISEDEYQEEINDSALTL